MLPAALQELAELEQWVIWKPRERGGKMTKPPFQGKEPSAYAKSNDPSTWCDHAAAERASRKCKEGGVGFVLTQTKYGGIDLDDCRDPKSGRVLFKWAQKILDGARGAYVEVSPSGKGFHVLGIAEGAKVDTRIDMDEGGHLELYRRTEGRYVTVTGEQVGKCDELTGIDELIDEYQDRVGSKAAEKDKSSSGLFHKYVLELFEKKNFSVDEIADDIRGRPRKWSVTKAEEFERKGRLEKEIERSISKWEQENDTKADQKAKQKKVKWFYGSVPGDSVADIVIAIEQLGIILRYDEFRDVVRMDYTASHKLFGILNDSHVTMLRDWITEEFGFEPGKDNTNDAVDRLALRKRFHPILDYLKRLVWDRKPRLDKWVCTYLGTENRPLFRTMGRKTLVAACARVLEPGIKFDTILVLEGPEGINKSTAIEVLAGTENFSDQTILGTHDKEQQEVLKGVWLHEIADLKGMRHAETEHIKAFASRKTDRARPAYGRRTEWRDRQCVFFATTNDREYLKGETGNRRFWPLPCGNIMLKALKRDRDQIWAEAFQCALEAESLELPSEMWEEARQEQEKRLPADLLLDKLREVQGTRWGDEERVATLTVAEDFLGIKGEGLGKNMITRKIAGAMRRIGWEGPKFMRISHARNFKQNGYWRQVDPVAIKSRAKRER